MSVPATTWQPAGPQGVRDTQDAIVQLLGFTKETFLASSLLLQGARSFASPGTSRVERCDLLMDGLGLTEYDAYRGLAEAERKAAEKTMLRLADRIEQDAAELERLPEADDRLEAAILDGVYAEALLTRAQADLDAHTEAWQQAQARSAERRAAEAEHEAAEKERRRLREQAEQADSARENIALNQARLAELADADALAQAEQAYSEARAEYDRAAFERQTLEATIAEVDQRRRTLDDEANDWSARLSAVGQQIQDLEQEDNAVCDACGQYLHGEARETRLTNLRADLVEYNRRFVHVGRAAWEASESCVGLREELAARAIPAAPSDLEVTRAREEMQERARLEERISTWQQAVAVVDAPGFAHESILAYSVVEEMARRLLLLPPIDQAELDRIKQQGLEARAAVHEAQQQLDRVRADKTRAEAEVERLTALQEKHADEKAQHAQAVEEAALAAACEQMYGRDGLPAYIIEKVAVPYLEEEATRIVRLLGKQWEIQIRVEKGLKSRDGTVAALDVQPVKENGVEQPYGICSGGEKMRIDLALMGAFLRLFRQRRNAHSDLFAIDEPEGLDAAGRETLVTWLHDLARTVPIVQLITHHTDLRDSFEQVVEVCHENGRSRIIGAERAAEVDLVTA